MIEKGKIKIVEESCVEISTFQPLACHLENSTAVTFFLPMKKEGAVIHLSHESSDDEIKFIFDEIVSYLELHSREDFEVKRVSSGTNKAVEIYFARLLVRLQPKLLVDETDLDAYPRKIFFFPESGRLRAEKVYKEAYESSAVEVDIERSTVEMGTRSPDAPGSRLF